MSSANFKLKRTAAASRGFLATAGFSCINGKIKKDTKEIELDINVTKKRPIPRFSMASIPLQVAKWVNSKFRGAA